MPVTFDSFSQDDTQVASASQTSKGTIQPVSDKFNAFIDALEQAESSGGINLFNKRTGATGPLQVTPIAVRDVGGDYSRAVEDHAYARGIGVQVAKKLWTQFGEDPALVAAAYHTGPTAVRKLLAKVPEGEDPANWVVSQLGPEGQGHNRKVLGRLTGQLDYDPNTGRMTEANAVKMVRPKVSFDSFNSEPEDIPEKSPGFNLDTLKATFNNTVSALKNIGGTTAVLGDMFLGFPSFIAGETGGLGSAIGAAVQGADAKLAWQAGRAGAEYFKGPDWISSPLGTLFKKLHQEDTYNESLGGKAMEQVSSLIKKAGDWAEKNSDGSIPAEAVETFVNQLMIGAGARGGRAVKERTEIKGDETLGARRPRANTEVSDAEIVSENKGNLLPAPKRQASFRDFQDDANADQFIADTLKEQQASEAADKAAKTRRLVRGGLAVGGAGALGAGAAYVYNQFKSPGNELIDQGTEVPEPKPGNEVGFISDKMPGYEQMLPGLLAIGAVKGKGGMWHPEAGKRLAAPLGEKIAMRSREHLANIEADQAIKYSDETLADIAKDKAAFAWSDRTIRNYLNKHAGTETDPLKDVEIPFGEGMKRWEDITDKVFKGYTKEEAKLQGINVSGIEKAKADELVYNVRPNMRNLEINSKLALTSYLSHVGDYLRQNVDPAKLQQYDLVRAVKETAANDARVAKEMEKAATASMKDMPIYKDYSDTINTTPVYHASPKKLTTITDNPLWLFKDKDLASEWVNGVGGQVDNINILYHKPGKTQVLDTDIISNYKDRMFLQQAVASAKKDEYRYIEFKDTGELVSLFPKEDIVTTRNTRNPGKLSGMKWVELKLPEKLTEEQAKGIRIATQKERSYDMLGEAEAGKHLWVAIDSKGNPIENSYTGRKAVGMDAKEAHLSGQLAQEGNQMGHCVGGYCEGVASGESRIFSLRDKKGRSHVTIEVGAPQFDRMSTEEFYHNRASNKLRETYPKPLEEDDSPQYLAWETKVENSDEFSTFVRNSKNDIIQIKGKQNRAPSAEYLPYVQDFVKSGKWGEVGDLQNTGLTDLHSIKSSIRNDIYSIFGEQRYANDNEIRNAFPDALPGSQVYRSPRNQQGSVDLRLVKALALAGVGAAAGATLLPDDRLTAALVGGVLALGLGHTKVSAFPQLIAPGSKLARSVERGIEASVQQFIRNINPDLMGKQAESTASVLGKNYTEMMQRQLGIEIPSQKRAEFWFRQGNTKGRSFLKAMERGATFTDPILQSYALAYRSWMSKIFKQDDLGGIKYEPVDNYIYHAFEDPVGATAYFEKRYGAKWGDPNFTRDRTFSLIEEAEKAGFKLKTENPESLMIMRQHASDIASMKVQTLRDLTEYGLARQLISVPKTGDLALDEAIKLSNKVKTGENVWRAPNGYLYALPDQTNQVMHNAFNTKSLWADPGAGGQVFRALSYAKNAIVPIQLFGLFHPLHVQLGMSFADPLVAMTKRVAAGTASFTDLMKEALTKATLTDIISTPKSGWRTLQIFRGAIPANKLTAMDKQNHALMLEGTFNPIMPVEYRNQHMRDFRQAVLQNSIMSAWHLPWAILEKFYTKPIFEHWIPSVKTAAYLRGAYAALEANPGLINSPLERINALRKISKMVDDRFGEVAYKTLFMNRMVKDVAVASFLSYGWQLGFMRSYVGAVPEAVSAIGAKGTLREKIAKGDLDKTMFVGYYVMGTMMYAGLLTYALTGQAPKDIMDYIYPRTGEKNPDGSEARVGTPFYTREFVSIPKHIQEEGVMGGLATTIGNKLSPAVGMLKAMVTNKDFFNREISNPNAPMMERLGQRLKYVFKSMEPISISGAEKGPPGEKTQALSALGFTPAPKYATDSAIEQKIKQVYGNTHNSPVSYEQGKKGDARSELYKLKQLGQHDAFETKLEQMKQDFHLTNKEVGNLRTNAEIPSTVRLFRQLNAVQQARLLHDMTPDEQAKYRPYAAKSLRYNQ